MKLHSASARTLTRGGFLLLLLTLVATPGQLEARHSNPGARHVLFLDFDGQSISAMSFGVGVTLTSTIPPFDLDGQPNSRSSAENAAIQEIWERVAEDFAPFDVDVTTIEPTNFVPGRFHGVRVVIGGDQVDIGSQLRNREVRGSASSSGHTGLVAQIFHNSVQGARSLAQTASHEAGHIFGSWLDYTYGLGHHTSTAVLPGRTRIMGTHADARDIWWKEQTVLATDTAGSPIYGVQEDVAVLLAALGVRPPDHGGVPEAGTPLLRVSGGSEVVLQGEGIVTMNGASLPRTCVPWSNASCPRVRDESTVGDELDFFLFRADPGRLIASVYPLSGEDSSDTRGNLDAEIELWRRTSDGTWIQLHSQGNGHSSGDLFARLSHTVPSSEAGVYAVAAKSQGNYGDLGEYTIEVRGEDVREYALNARVGLPQAPFIVFVPVTIRPGETVTIVGGGFVTASSLLFSPLARASVVHWNGVAVPTSVESPTELSFEIPADAFCGESQIRVVNAPRLSVLGGSESQRMSGSVAVDVAGECTRRPAIHIYRIFPASARPGTRVTVDGIGFGGSLTPPAPFVEETTVLLGGQPVSHQLVDATRLTFVVPDDVECADYDVQVLRSEPYAALPLLANPLPIEVIVNPQPQSLPKTQPLPKLIPSPLPLPAPIVPLPVAPLPTPQLPVEPPESNLVTLTITGACGDLPRDPDESELELLSGAEGESGEPGIPIGGARIAPVFQRGDTNGDGWLDISDATVILDTLYLGAAEIPCQKSADANDSGEVDQADAVSILTRLFVGGVEIPAPRTRCGSDPTEDGLSCEVAGACEDKAME